MSNVRLMHYDPRWKQEFQQTRSSILQSCLGLVAAVQHIGSTAISGLIARPTIDVMATLGKDHQADPRALSEAAELIEGLNFRRVPTPNRSEPFVWSKGTITLEKPRHGDTTHRIFLMTDEDQSWRDAIAIRDHLRNHPEVAIRFEEAKVARWRSKCGDQAIYEAGKALFFTHLIDQIRA